MSLFKTTYEFAELRSDTKRIFLDGKAYMAIEGKHCIWIPELELKIPWTYNGKIEARYFWDKGVHAEELKNQTFNDDVNGWHIPSLDSIDEEYNIMAALAALDMSPKVLGFCRINNMQSIYTRTAMHCDPVGAIGYYVQDATKLSKGKYTFDRFKYEFIDSGMIGASPGALGDLKKTENVVNGYLVDARRTIWDMMRLNAEVEGPKLKDQNLRHTTQEIREQVLYKGQFPHKQRRSNYESYYLYDTGWIEGSRDTLYRINKMGIEESLKGKTILDLGCQIGSMATACYLKGARHITGIDNEYDYVKCARDIARYNGHQINYQHMDLRNINNIDVYIRKYYDGPVDILLMLSMIKHIGTTCWKLLYELDWRQAYIESNNQPAGYDGHQSITFEAWTEYLKKNMKVKITRLGMTEDRSPRCLWRLDRE